MTTQLRARKGGQIGTNGQHYNGGSFLPTTKLGKMGRTNAKAARKPAPFWRAVSGLCRFNGDQMEIIASDASLAYFKVSREEVQAICDRYNAGER